MWIFVLIILAGAITQTMLKVSLLNRGYRIALICGTIVLTAFFYRQATQYNLADLRNYLNSETTLNTLCGAVIIQELLTLVFGTILLRRYFTNKIIKKIHYIVLLPSVLYPLSYQLLLVYLFNTRSGIDYLKTNLLLCAVAVICTIAASEFSSKLSLQRKIEFIALSSVITISLAMFLPVIFAGGAPGGEIIVINLNMIKGAALILGLVLLFSIASYYDIYSKIIKHIKINQTKEVLK